MSAIAVTDIVISSMSPAKPVIHFFICLSFLILVFIRIHALRRPVLHAHAWHGRRHTDGKAGSDV